MPKGPGAPRLSSPSHPAPVPDRLVIIPTYNEQENIRDILAHVLRLTPAFHVLVVDDG